MTWTYDVATLGTNTTADVRLMIGDTNTLDQQLADEEIAWLITQEGSTYLAAARAAETIAAKYSREVDMKGGGIDLRASQAAAAYTILAIGLRTKARMFVAPYAGGISASDKDANTTNTDRTPPAFWTGMETNPGAPGPTDAPTSVT